jgi:hypothetical protein
MVDFSMVFLFKHTRCECDNALAQALCMSFMVSEGDIFVVYFLIAPQKMSSNVVFAVKKILHPAPSPCFTNFFIYPNRPLLTETCCFFTHSRLNPSLPLTVQ